MHMGFYLFEHSRRCSRSQSLFGPSFAAFFFFAAPCCDFSAGCSAALRSGFVPLNGAVVDGCLWKDHVQSACLRIACATSREIIYMFVEVPDWNAPRTNMMLIISIPMLLHQPFSVGSNFPHVLEIPFASPPSPFKIPVAIPTKPVKSERNPRSTTIQTMKSPQNTT